MSLQVQALRTVTVPLRLERSDGVIRTIQLTVIDRDEWTEEVRLYGATIGFVERAGSIFVALTGTRLDLAEECGQCLLWDKAATMLVGIVGRLPEPEEPDPRTGAPAYAAVGRGLEAGHEPTRRHSRVHEMSR